MNNNVDSCEFIIRLASSPPTTIAPSTTESITENVFVDFRNSLNNYGQSSTPVAHLSDKGSKYQSNLNEIDKSEQKSSVDSSKGFGNQKIETLSSNGHKLIFSSTIIIHLLLITTLMHTVTLWNTF